MIDGDGMGRAFPELQMDTFSIYGPPPTPAAIADPYGQTAHFDGIADPRTLERYARAITIQMGGAAGYAFPPMSGADVKRMVVPHTMTLIHAIGDAVLRARAEHQDAIASLLRIMREPSSRATSPTFRGDCSAASPVGSYTSRVWATTSARRCGSTSRTNTLSPEPAPAASLRRARSDLHGRGRDRRSDHHRGSALWLARRGPGYPGAGPAETPEALAVVGPAAFGYPDVAFEPLPGTYASGLGAAIGAAR